MKIEINSQGGIEPNGFQSLMSEIICLLYVIIAIFSPLRWLTIVAIVMAVENLFEAILYGMYSGLIQRKEKNGINR